jgi:polyhydroxybutyrate depolymerase
MNVTKRNFEEEVVFNNLVRRYHVHLPSNYEAFNSLPLLIALHGRLGTGKKMIRQTGFNGIADREGFIVVYPEGFKRGWADGRGITHADRRGVDDVAFIDKLIRICREKFNLDHTRIFAAGHSNGGFMAQRLAIERSQHFAAVAVVAASLSESLASKFTPSRPMPILFIHGTADPVTPYAGDQQLGGAKVLSVAETVKIWTHFNSCNECPQIEEINGLDDTHAVSVFTYKHCRNHAQVRQYRIEGGGHVWPGEPEDLSRSGGGTLNAGIDASEEIWNFFKSIAS